MSNEINGQDEVLAHAIKVAKENRTKDEVLEVLTPEEFPLVAERDRHAKAWKGNRVITRMEEEYLELTQPQVSWFRRLFGK